MIRPDKPYKGRAPKKYWVLKREEYEMEKRGKREQKSNPNELGPSTYRSNTGGTVNASKAALTPSKRAKASSSMPDSSKHDTSGLKFFGKGA
jgi:hypothetical protein